jgi:hypothetical protein
MKIPVWKLQPAGLCKPINMVIWKYRRTMKTTIEIPEPLFRQVKVKAAMEGLTLRDLFVRGLQLALQTPSTPAGQRLEFPLIRAAEHAPQLTDEQIYAALNTDEGLV